MLKLLLPLKRTSVFLAIVSLCMFGTAALHAAVPPNDSCGGAIPIIIGNGGFSLGLFTSTNTDLTSATLQTGETFAPSIIVAGLNKKSIWYKFSLPTTRAARISLAQPGSSIQAGNVGFAVYKSNKCLPGNADISNKFSPIEIFGSSYHPCVEAGDYLVQVTGNLNANGPVFITVDLADPSPALYDKPADAYKFTNINTNKVNVVDYEVQCQSIDNAAENCLPNGSLKDYTKSTWQTFTTPPYFDHVTSWLGVYPGNYGTPSMKVGYRIYEGDATISPLTSLVSIGGCDSIITDLYAVGKKNYHCGDLKPNTTYTIQLLFHKDFNNNIRVGIEWNGSKPTNGPLPVSSLATPNKMGTLSANGSLYGVANNVADVFGCNSRHSQNNCPKSMPVKGVLFNGLNYNMSSFVSFNLATTSSVYFNTTIAGCNGVLLRLYQQNLTTSCADLDTANLVATFDGSVYAYTPLSCLASGNYVLQVMGVDSAKSSYIHFPSSLGNSVDNYLCSFYNLGSSFNVRINVRSEVPINKFSLSATGKFDKLNVNALGVMQPLQRGTTYTAIPDTMGCANTVLPDDNLCKSIYNETYTKASYREFVVTDSFILSIPDYLSTSRTSKLYKGDANALVTAQNVFSFPQKITGLQPYSFCMYGYSGNAQNACVVPGTYTIANFDNRVGVEATTKFTIIQPRTKYALPSRAQDMGDAWSKIDPVYNMLMSDVDTFTCYDNPVVIDGLSPCTGIYSAPANKLIYRQFYLSKPAIVAIFTSYNGYPYYKDFSGKLSLFAGKATDGLAALKTMGAKWTCFNYGASVDPCDALPVGWYTVVSYGVGPTYSNPLPNNAYDVQFSDLGKESGFFIRLTSGCAPPQFNRPYKASVDTATKNPYLIQWGPQTGHTAAYPVTAKKYTLNSENFDCSQDTSFIRQYIKTCDVSNVKVAFYVFKITQDSYLQIDGITNGLWSSLYAFDVRTSDSSKLKTDNPFQPCLDKVGTMEYCKLQPGTYTLVFFAPASYSCNVVAPSIYIDQVGVSRFDHATNAYDFGAIKPDSTWYNGKQGDINPLNSGRAPSNDFFYCTTGARDKDPSDAVCYTAYNPYIYTAGNNVVLHPDNATAPNNSTIDRRNLWYTFTVDQPGNITIRVDNKTPGKAFQYPFTAYKSDVNGNLPFSSVVAGGLVDSTLLDGLTFVKTNLGYICTGSNEISFYNEPCSFKPTRYYILVENRNSIYYAAAHEMNPNSQVEVSILLDSVTARPPKFDHFSQANDMGLVNSGIKKGAVDNFTCATKDLPDPLNYTYVSNCNKTLWYKFTTTITGQIRYAEFFKNTNNYYYDHIQLFRQIKPNDSSITGLQTMPHTSTYSNNGTWAQQCISPGTYYIILPGCNAVNEDVYPQIEIVPQAGDFCSFPMIASLTGAGNKVVPVTVDCHTIGTDYGEFNPTLTCPAGAVTSNYKTSWYRLDIAGTDTLDITVFIDEKTNAGSTDIKYRLMTGTCGAMQEQSCVQDALTRNTYKCLSPGNSYYIQVFSPTLINGYTQVTGDIDLNIQAVVHADTCLPASTCIGVANFTPEFDCTKDKDVIFTNFSTFGSSIKYDWDFGYNNQKSNAVSPRFNYPALTVAKTYTVKMVLTNLLCGKKDSVTQTISIPARPSVNLGNDTVICNNGASILLDATSHAGSTYFWAYNGSTQPSITLGVSAAPVVEVTYNGCKARDTINIFINPVTKRGLQTKALCAVTQVTLDASRGQGEQYQWNTGAVSSSIAASQPGYYWVDIYLRGCFIRDSFLVVSTSLRPLGNDTALCQASIPYTANASVSGATSYTWQNNSTSGSFNISKAGVYWVDINLGGCSFRDSLTVTIDSFKQTTTSARICLGQTYTLPTGKVINATGIYKDSLKNSRGCDSIITTLTLTVDTVKRITNNVSLCASQLYTLPGGTTVGTAGTYIDTLKNTRGCDSLLTTVNLSIATVLKVNTSETICNGIAYILPSGKSVSTTGIYMDTLRAVAGCDSLVTTVNLTVLKPITNNTTASICLGQAYLLPTGSMVSTAGVYRDTLRYANGCDSLIRSVTLTVNGKPSLGSDKSITTCFGNTASLTNQYTATGLSSSWTLGGATVLTPSAVSTAGIYQLIASNGSGCADTALVTLTISPKPVLGADKDDSICQGGTVDLTTQFTTTGLTTNWTLAGVTVTNPFLVAGSGAYQLIAGNAGGCADTAIFTLTSLPKPTLGADKSASICLGNSANLTTQYNTPGITSDWTLNGVAVITPSFVNIAGIYQLIASAGNGCSDTALLTLVVNPRPDLGIDKAAVICAGNTYNLSSQFTTTGLTSNWTLNGAVTAVNAVTMAGLYQLIVTNGSGCRDTATITLTINPKPTLGADKAISICQGNTVDLTTTFTTIGLTTNWTLNGTALANPVSVTTGGVYQLIAINSGNCSDTALITVTVNPTPSLGYDKLAGICAGNSLNLNNQFTTTGLTTNWTLNGAAVVNTSAVVPAGIYQLIVSSGSGCKDTALVTLTVNPKPALGSDKTISICQGNTADLTKEFTTAGLTTNWTLNGTSVSNPSVVTIAGMYQLIAANNNGCSDTALVTLTVIPKPTLGADKSLAICAGNSVSLMAQFNTTGLSLNWASNGVIVNNPAAVTAAGIYQLVAISTAGCKDTADVTVSVAAKPSIGADKAITICAGNTVNLTTQFITTGLTTNWTIGGAAVSAPSAVTQAGVYQLIVSNGSGCTDTALFNLTVNASPSLGADKTVSFCAGGSINLTSQFVTTGLTSTWSLNGNAIALPTVITASGTYRLIVANSFGCTDTALAIVSVNMLPTVKVANPVPVCTPATANLTDASVTSGSTAGLSYTYWTDAATTAALTNANAAPSGMYYIKGTDTNGCFDSRPVTVTVYALPVVDAGTDTAVCDQSFAILRGNATNLGIGTVGYLWSPATGLSNITAATIIARPGASVTYRLTATVDYGTCVISVSDDVNIIMQPPVVAFAGNDTVAVTGVPHQLKATGGVNYLWSPASVLNNASVVNPVATLRQDTRFTVMVTDIAGCKASATVLVKVYDGITYYLPNAFSPNGDGLNDFFRPVSVGIVSTDYFRIYSRYGQLIYETSQPSKGWDGTYKGIRQPVGNYVWIIKGMGNNGRVIEMKGNVVLVR